MRIGWVVIAVAAASSTGAAAQSVRVADSLFQAGDVAAAESVYYAAVQARPRDPIARWALGRYLVSRGAVRVGATLFEESLQFGGEQAIVGRDLAAAYLVAGNYSALATLGAATPAERQRAKWLASRSPRVVAPDPVIVALFRPTTRAGAPEIGRMPIRINGHTVEAAVTAAVQGIVISDTSAVSRTLRRFGAARRGAERTPVLAAADSVGLGRLEMTAVPVSIERVESGYAALLGLDALARFAPTFDVASQRIDLRAGGIVVDPSGQRFPVWMASSDVRVARAGGWISITNQPLSQLLHEHAWTLDIRRGELVLSP